jgi:hypothetical protein
MKKVKRWTGAKDVLQFAADDTTAAGVRPESQRNEVSEALTFSRGISHRSRIIQIGLDHEADSNLPTAHVDSQRAATYAGADHLDLNFVSLSFNAIFMGHDVCCAVEIHGRSSNTSLHHLGL